MDQLWADENAAERGRRASRYAAMSNVVAERGAQLDKSIRILDDISLHPSVPCRETCVCWCVLEEDVTRIPERKYSHVEVPNHHPACASES